MIRSEAGEGAPLLAPDQLLLLSRWLSPAFPTGAFAWSHGLEAAIRAGEVGDAPSLLDWLDALLRWGAGRADAILLGSAHRAEGEAEVLALAELADALAPSRERRAEAMALGTAFAVAVRAADGLAVPDAPLPVALGRAARLAGLPALPVALVHLQATVTTLAQAAQRLMPLGQTAAQGVLAALAPVARQVAEEAASLAPDDLGSSALAIDVASMRHEVLEPRLFRS
jgi:urease accessory protein